MDSNQNLPRILLVDDHRDTVEFTAFFLIKRGYTVARAYSAAEARLEVARHLCDVIISDIGLPDGSGIELLDELRKKYSLKGILVSGSMQDGEAVEARGFKFLAKPVQLEALLDAIHSASSLDG